MLRPDKEASAGTGPWGSCSQGPAIKHVTTGQVLLWGPRTARLAKSNGGGVGEAPHGPQTTGQPPSQEPCRAEGGGMGGRGAGKAGQPWNRTRKVLGSRHSAQGIGPCIPPLGHQAQLGPSTQPPQDLQAPVPPLSWTGLRWRPPGREALASPMDANARKRHTVLAAACAPPSSCGPPPPASLPTQNGSGKGVKGSDAGLLLREPPLQAMLGSQPTGLQGGPHGGLQDALRRTWQPWPCWPGWTPAETCFLFHSPDPEGAEPHPRAA